MKKMEKYNKKEIPNFNSFGNEFPDGRLCEPGGNTPAFCMRAVIDEIERLGRPLTDEEFKQFVIKDDMQAD